MAQDGELKPHEIERLAQRISDLYAAAEVELLQLLAKHLAKGLDLDEQHWTERQLLELRKFQQAAQELIEKLSAESAEVVATIVAQAGNRGAAVAVGSLAAGSVASAAVDPYAVTAIAAELEQTLTRTRWHIYRDTNDIYRKVIAETAPQATLGVETRRQTARKALTRFAEEGITGFTDKAGKRWEMSTYVEAASRQATKEAAIQGHVARLESNGHNLVMISDVPQECAKCRPWEGKIVAIKPDGKHSTLDDARRGGLFHVNCRHSLKRYIPGRTKGFGETADPQGDKDRQKLRYLERCVRKAKRAEAAAIDDEARAAARKRVRAYQAQIRDHVDSTSAVRRPDRERIGPTTAR
ncbi:phage minor capsid protein [Gordonia sp. NPDC003376]